MDKDKEIKIQIVGMGASGISESVATVLAERGISINDVIVINQDDFKDIEKTKEMVKNLPIGKIILIEDLDILLASPIEPKVYKFENIPNFEPTIKYENSHIYNKKNFGGHKSSKNQKLRRR